MTETSNPLGIGDTTTIDHAAKAVEKLLKGDPKPEQEKPAPAEDTAPDEAAPQDDTPETEQPEIAEEAAIEPRKFKVKVDGEEAEVDESELIQGYQRQQDYTRKTQEAANRLREADEKFTRVTAAETKIQQDLQFAHMVQQANLPKPPERELLDTDPHAYMRQQRDYEDGLNVIRAIEQAHRESVDRTNEQQAEANKKTSQDNATKLFAAIPELKVPEKQKEWAGKAQSTLSKDYGFTDQEIASVTDHRLLLVVNDAMKYRELQAKKPVVEDKLKNAPPLQAGKRSTPQEQKAKLNEEAMKRLNRTGRVEDAASIIKQRMEKK